MLIGAEIARAGWAKPSRLQVEIMTVVYLSRRTCGCLAFRSPHPSTCPNAPLRAACLPCKETVTGTRRQRLGEGKPSPYRSGRSDFCADFLDGEGMQVPSWGTLPSATGAWPDTEQIELRSLRL